MIKRASSSLRAIHNGVDCADADAQSHSDLGHAEPAPVKLDDARVTADAAAGTGRHGLWHGKFLL
jgi:hypothetical protein